MDIIMINYEGIKLFKEGFYYNYNNYVLFSDLLELDLSLSEKIITTKKILGQHIFNPDRIFILTLNIFSAKLKIYL